MNERRKSDSPILPGKPSNKGHGAPWSAERVEERGLAKENPLQRTRLRTQGREGLQQALERIRQAACKDKRLRFIALWHHVYSQGRLRKAYFELKRNAAAGVDGETWRHYGEDLENNLRGLSGRLCRGAYRAKPVSRVYIPERGWWAASNRDNRIRGQDCPACGYRGIGSDLRDGLQRLFLRIPTRAKPAQCVGRSDRRNMLEQSGLGARYGHSAIFGPFFILHPLSW